MRESTVLKNWSEDQEDGFREGQLHIAYQKLKDNPNRERCCCHDRHAEYWRVQKEEMQNLS